MVQAAPSHSPTSQLSFAPLYPLSLLLSVVIPLLIFLRLEWRLSHLRVTISYQSDPFQSVYKCVWSQIW